MGFVQVENKIYIFLHLFCIQWSPESVRRMMVRLNVIDNGVPAFWLAVFSMVWYNDDQQRSIEGGRVRELQELINNSYRQNKRKNCLMSVFISDIETAKQYVQFFR